VNERLLSKGTTVPETDSGRQVSVQSQISFSTRLDRPWLICLILAAAVFAVYWPALRFDFISLDDPVYFSENRHVLGGLTLANVMWAFQTTADASWYPLSWLSFIVDAQLFGSGPAGPHAMNVLLHALNCVLLFLVLKRFTGSTWRSAFVAALFGLHPLRVESVAWISERKDVLSTLFFLLTLFAYAHYVQQSKDNGAPKGQTNLASAGARASVRAARWYVIALCFFALGLLSKPMLVTLPFVILLLDFWPLRRFELPLRKHQFLTFVGIVREKLPFFALAAIFSAVTLVVCKKTEAIDSLSSVSMAGRIENAFVSYSRYLWKTVWPTDLTLPYLHPGHWPLAWVIPAALLIVGLAVAACLAARRRPYVSVGWFWFFGTLVPVIGLIQWGFHSMADRFTYVPSIGLAVIFAWGLGELVNRWAIPAPIIAAAAALLLVACALRSEAQLRFWRNSEVLFTHTLKVTQGNYVAFDSLGSALSRRGAIAEALELCTQAVRLNPHYAEAQYDVGTILMQQSRLSEAIPHLQAAVKYEPKFAMAHYNLGTALLRSGKMSEAGQEFQAAIQYDPEDPEAYYSLGTIWLGQSDPGPAAACFSQALRLRPNYAAAESNFGIALARLGHPAEASAHFANAVRLTPQDPEARFNLGVSFLELNQPDKAAETFSAALRLDDRSPKTHYHLALALMRLDKRKEAILHAETARDLAKAAGQPELAAKADELIRSDAAPKTGK
jgi:protein O-mannosyl-transferase